MKTRDRVIAGTIIGALGALLGATASGWLNAEAPLPPPLREPTVDVARPREALADQTATATEPASAAIPKVEVIASLPAVITRAGRYVLQDSLSYALDDGHAVTIEADNVTLDLQGHSLTCVSSNARRRCIGVFADRRKNITIRQGNIDGFFMGVHLLDVSKDRRYVPEHGWHLVEELCCRRNTFRGLRVEGLQCIIRHNRIGHTGGCLLFPDAYSMGLEAIGSALTIAGNAIYDTFTAENGEAVGLSLTGSGKGSVVENNCICNVGPPRFRSFGIWVCDGNDVAVVAGNRVQQMTWGMGGNLDGIKNNEFRECANIAYPSWPSQRQQLEVELE